MPDDPHVQTTNLPVRPTRRELFLLAAALAGTVLTGGAAIAGLTRVPTAQPAPVVPQVQATPPRVEPGD